MFAVDMKAKRKKEFAVTVTIINQDGTGVKKSRVVLLDKDGEKIKDGKTNKNGKYTFKKLKAGSYTLLAEHKKEGDGEKKFNSTIENKIHKDSFKKLKKVLNKKFPLLKINFKILSLKD